jgi:hypothetical protein
MDTIRRYSVRAAVLSAIADRFSEPSRAAGTWLTAMEFDVLRAKQEVVPGLVRNMGIDDA